MCYPRGKFLVTDSRLRRTSSPRWRINPRSSASAQPGHLVHQKEHSMFPCASTTRQFSSVSRISTWVSSTRWRFLDDGGALINRPREKETTCNQREWEISTRATTRFFSYWMQCERKRGTVEQDPDECCIFQLLLLLLSELIVLVFLIMTRYISSDSLDVTSPWFTNVKNETDARHLNWSSRLPVAIYVASQSIWCLTRFQKYIALRNRDA